MARPRVVGEKPLDWVGSSKRDFLAFPSRVKDEMGAALGVAQFGGKHPSAKPWKGQGSGIFEIVEDDSGDTYRAVYVVRFREVVYVLHAFQKKSKKGIATPKHEMDLVRARLLMAEELHQAKTSQKKGK